MVGVEPRIMGIGPVGATQQALSQSRPDTGSDRRDRTQRSLRRSKSGLHPFARFSADNDPRINPNGGAIALGHPLGMSGSRILYSAALELHLQQKRYALATMCVGVGQGYAVVLERT